MKTETRIFKVGDKVDVQLNDSGRIFDCKIVEIKKTGQPNNYVCDVEVPLVKQGNENQFLILKELPMWAIELSEPKEEVNTEKGDYSHPQSAIDYEEAVSHVMKYLAENHHPHTTMIITANTSELLVGRMNYNTDKFLVD